MNCAEVNDLLDLLMDGELSDEQRQAMEAHGRECPECAAAIRSAKQLKALFDQMEPEVDVPLAAQAGWRGAVREASKRQRSRRLTRWVASAAAAAVVLVGVGLTMNLGGGPRKGDSLSAAPAALNEVVEADEDAEEGIVVELEDAGMEMAAEEASAAEADSAVPEVRAAAAPNSAAEAAYEAMPAAEACDSAEGAVVEADGAAEAEAPAAVGGMSDRMLDMAKSDAEEPIGAAAAPRAPAFELAMRVEDVDTACDRIRDLAEEYEGTADVQKLADGGANVYVEIDAANAGDFFNAIAPMDTSGQAWDLSGLSDAGSLLVLLEVNG